MGYIDGDALISGAILSFQQVNRMKDNWRGAAAVSNPQGGMLFSKSTNDILSHYGAAWKELLQADIPFSDGLAAIFGTSSDVCMGYLDAGDIFHICDGGVLGTTPLVSIKANGLGFFDTTPATQPAAIADATGPGNIVDRCNDALAALRTLGLIAT